MDEPRQVLKRGARLTVSPKGWPKWWMKKTMGGSCANAKLLPRAYVPNGLPLMEVAFSVRLLKSMASLARNTVPKLGRW